MWHGSDGTLDQAFDGDAAMPGHRGNGVVNTGTTADAFAAATQADGKVVVTGTDFGSDDVFRVARYNRDGTLDTSFDGDAAMPSYPGNGVVTTDVRVSASIERAFAITIQRDGKILLAGRTVVAGSDDMALVRYNADGTLDTSFDGDAAMPGYPGTGKVVRDMAGEFDEAHSVAVRPDGRIVVAGTGLHAGTARFALLQLNADGSLDATFDGDATMPLYPGNGRVVTAFAGASRGYAMVLQADGMIVVNGVTDNGAERNFAIARCASDGTLDVTFDGSAAMPGYPGNGKVTTAYGSTSDNYFGGLAQQADGKLVQSGSLLGGGSEGVAVARYNVDGSLDTSFDGDAAMPGYPGNGVVRTIMPSLMYTTHDAMVTPDSRIVVVADTDNAGDSATTLVYRTDGTLDTSFSGDGVAYANPTGGDDAVRGVTLGIDGRIVTVGSFGDVGFLLLSYEGLPVPDWNSGVNDWSTSAFGTCLSATSGGAGWVPTLNCPTGTPSAWHAVPDHSGSSGNVVATSPSGTTNTTASMRFGFRPSPTQKPGAYVAPVVFEVVAT